jgi:hypothetical protein
METVLSAEGQRILVLISGLTTSASARSRFTISSVMFLMAKVKSKRAKNEVRDALLVSLGLAVIMFTLALAVRAHS